MSAPVPVRHHRPGAGRKLAVVAAIVAFTTGLSGYFMGRLQTDRTAARLRAETRVSLESAETQTPAAESKSAPIAPTYTELGDRTRQPNHLWRSNLASLARPPAFTSATPPLTADERVLLSARRIARRAFNGAPPTVPHPIDQYQSSSCLACHGQPTRIGTVDVPQMSHEAYTHCIQCHAPSQGPGTALARSPLALSSPSVENQFVGLPPPAGGTRAFFNAPPTIPHSSAMRQNCVSCHGPGGSSLIKTTHPERQNCVQCHALDAARETVPLTLPPPPPAAPRLAINP